MGLTCANIHVFSGVLTGTGPTETDQLIGQAGQRLGYEAATPRGPGERQLTAVAGSMWTTVLESEGAGLVTEALIDLARELSTVSAGPVLIGSVYDSDEFALLVFERGKQVDGHASADQLVPIRFKKWPANRRSQEWSRLFGKILTAADLQKVLKPTGSFADDQLLQLGRLLAIPPAQTALVWKDLDRNRSEPDRNCGWRRNLARRLGRADQGGADLQGGVPMGLR